MRGVWLDLSRFILFFRLVGGYIRRAISGTSALKHTMRLNCLRVFIRQRQRQCQERQRGLHRYRLRSRSVRRNRALRVPILHVLHRRIAVRLHVLSHITRRLTNGLLILVITMLKRRLLPNALFEFRTLSNLRRRNISSDLIVIPMRTLFLRRLICLIILHGRYTMRLTPRFAVVLVNRTVLDRVLLVCP